MGTKPRRGNHEGTIKERTDGRWEARVTLPNGRRKSVYGASRKEARDKLAEARARITRGENLATQSAPVSQYLVRWLEDVAKASVRESTYRSYESWVRNHLALPRSHGGIGDIKLDRLTATDVQQMLANRSRAGLSPTSVDHVRRTLRIALNQAIKSDLVSRNAAALSQPPKRERHEIESLSIDEIRTLLKASRDHRLHQLILFAVHTGMRQGELLALRWRDVDLDKRQIKVRATIGRRGGQPAFLPPKSEQSRRTLKLSLDCLTALREQRQRQLEWRLLAGDRWVDHDLIFSSIRGTALNGSSVTHEFQKVLVTAGLRRVRFHDLRHSAASFLLEAGQSMRVVQDQLGHSGLAYTIATYTDVSTAMKQGVADTMDGLALIE